MFRSAWIYRHFIFSSIHNEIVTRFTQSKFGGLWIIINPLSQVAIYTIILSNVLSAKIPGITYQNSYAAYLMAGLLCWTLFNDLVARSLTLFIDQGNLIKKVNFPRITLPIILLGSSLLNNFLLFVSLLVIMMVIGYPLTTAVVWIIPLAVLTASIGIGIGLLVGVINVFIRDLGQAVPIILQVWFWFTPIVYPKEIVPQEYISWIELNPLGSLIESYQRILVYGEAPEYSQLIITIILALALLLAGLAMFRRASAEMIDVL